MTILKLIIFYPKDLYELRFNFNKKNPEINDFGVILEY